MQKKVNILPYTLMLAIVIQCGIMESVMELIIHFINFLLAVYMVEVTLVLIMLMNEVCIMCQIDVDFFHGTDIQ